jgi:hypothetical protein
MNKELSINPEISEVNLEDKRFDNAAAAIKAAVSFVPHVGSILTEVVGIVIPDQKSNRVKLFVEVLADKVTYIEKDVLELKMKSEKFTDLFEDALPQAARALTDERREYIANFLKNSLNTEEVAHIGEKKLLSLLNELNDAEVIFLRYEALENYEKDEFYENHSAVLQPVPAPHGSSQSEYDKLFLRRSYQEKLQDLGLMQPVFKSPRKGEMPEFDEKTGRMKSNYQKITGLGRLFLRYIDETYVDDQAQFQF